jgi:hypothetical protein
MVATRFRADQREDNAKLGVIHEVTAARAGRPSGRTVIQQLLFVFERLDRIEAGGAVGGDGAEDHANDD